MEGLSGNKKEDFSGTQCPDGLCTEQTECTQTVRTLGIEMAGVLFPDSPFFLIIQMQFFVNSHSILTFNTLAKAKSS